MSPHTDYEMLMTFSIDRKKQLFLRALLRAVLTILLLAVSLLSVTSSALAYGENDCAATRFGSDLGCTAGDVSITGIAVAPGSPTSCVGGETFTVDLDITINFATPDRWDIGIFLSEDGNDPKLLPTSGGSSSCAVGILPTSNPFLDLDPNGGLDTCGDGNGSINGGTGSGVVRMEDVVVPCQAIALSGGNLYVPFVVSWDNQSSPSGSDCTSIADPVPNTTSKCNAPNTSLATEVAYGTVDAVVLPDITKIVSAGSVNPGDSVTYTVVISNTTGVPLNNALFTDPAVANLTVNSVSCSAAGGASCPTTTIAGMQGAGLTLPHMPVGSSLTFTLGATVADPIVPSYTHEIVNEAYVTVRGETNAASDDSAIIGAVYSDLSTSTKTVVDLNGGEADPGDVLRYTITLNETAGNAVTAASVTDDIPAYISSFSVVSIPTGATDSSTGAGTGANGTGYLNVTGINLAANATDSIVFDVTIAAGTPAGTDIDNAATVTNTSGPGATPFAPTVTVSPSAVPVTDNKKLYLYGSSSSPASMSRAMPTAPQTTVSLGKNGSVTWNGNWDGSTTTPLQLDNTVAAAYASLYLTADTTQSRKVETRLYCSSTPSAYATSGVYDIGTVPITPTLYNFNLTSLVGGFSFPATCTADNYWVLDVLNTTNQNTYVYPINGSDYSRVNLDSSNVIYVESLEFYDAAYPGGFQVTAVAPGATVYARAVVSDPFGSFDISTAVIDIVDPDGTTVVPGVSMTEKNDSGLAEKTFEYAYTLLPGAATGNWTVTVTANEGTEGTVTDDQTSSFNLPAPPNVTLAKMLLNVGTSGYDIPGEIVQYTLIVTNADSRTLDNDSIYLIDQIPANTTLVAAETVADPAVTVSNSTAVTGLTLNYTAIDSSTDDVEFSQDGINFNYQPTADGVGIDDTVTHIRFHPTGAMKGTFGTTSSFTVTFKVRID